MISVHYGRNKYDFEASPVSGGELRRKFNVPLADDLYRAHGSKLEGDPINDAEMVEIKNGDHFTSAPRDVSGGLTAQLPGELEAEIADVLGEFESFGPTRRIEEAGQLALTLPMPAPGWSHDPMTVLIRVPGLYPLERPDLLFLPAGAAAPGGGVPPRKMTEIALGGQQWSQISWHFTGAFDPTQRNLQGFARSAMLYLRNPAR